MFQWPTFCVGSVTVLSSRSKSGGISCSWLDALVYTPQSPCSQAAVACIPGSLGKKHVSWKSVVGSEVVKRQRWLNGSTCIKACIGTCWHTDKDKFLQLLRGMLPAFSLGGVASHAALNRMMGLLKMVSRYRVSEPPHHINGDL